MAYGCAFVKPSCGEQITTFAIIWCTKTSNQTWKTGKPLCSISPKIETSILWPCLLMARIYSFMMFHLHVQPSAVSSFCICGTVFHASICGCRWFNQPYLDLFDWLPALRALYRRSTCWVCSRLSLVTATLVPSVMIWVWIVSIFWPEQPASSANSSPCPNVFLNYWTRSTQVWSLNLDLLFRHLDKVNNSSPKNDGNFSRKQKKSPGKPFRQVFSFIQFFHWKTTMERLSLVRRLCNNRFELLVHVAKNGPQGPGQSLGQFVARGGGVSEKLVKKSESPTFNVFHVLIIVLKYFVCVDLDRVDRCD